MINPGQLAGMTQQAYASGGVTGLSVQPLREAAKERRDYERKQQDSIYEITADLDAQAYATVSQEVDQIFQDVADKKIYYDSPEMKGRLSALRGKAKAMSETDAILKAATDQFTKNPDGFVFMSEDENGLPAAKGYTEFVAELQKRRGESFEAPEEYMQSINGVLQRVGSRIDEKQVVPKIQKSITDLADEYHKTIEAAKASGAQTAQIGRAIVRVDQNTDITQFATQIEDAIMEGYADDIAQLGALYRGRGGESLDNEQFGRRLVQDNMALTRRDISFKRDASPPKPSDDDNNLFRSIGNSSWQSGDYVFELVDKPSRRELSSQRGQRGDATPYKISVTSMRQGETPKIFIDEDEDNVAGKLATITVDAKGKITAEVIGSKNPRTIKYEDNAAKFSEFYGITKQNILDMIGGDKGDIRGANKSTETEVLDW